MKIRISSACPGHYCIYNMWGISETLVPLMGEGGGGVVEGERAIVKNDNLREGDNKGALYFYEMNMLL